MDARSHPGRHLSSDNVALAQSWQGGGRLVLFLQGDEDAIVPPEQSEKMYQALVKKGIPTAYILFHQEQHGFRQAANIKRTVEAIAYFFSKILGFQLADKIEPVKIENFDEK